MLSYVRSFTFDALFYVGTLVLSIVALPVLLGPRRWCILLSRFWCRSILWTLKHIVDLDYRVTGHLPKGPMILASKHQSAWETFMLPLLIYDPAFILKQELILMPIIGWYLKKAGMLSVRRNQKGKGRSTFQSQAVKVVEEGRSLVVFPEGTRTLYGTQPPLKRGVLTLYKALGIPVVPVSLNSGRYWSRRTLCKKPGVISVTIHQPLSGNFKDPKDFLEKLHDKLNT